MPKTKVTSSHRTMIEEADVLRVLFENISSISKISAGWITPLTNGPISIKILNESGCVCVRVRGKTAVQDIRAYTTDYEETVSLIKLFVEPKKWTVR